MTFPGRFRALVAEYPVLEWLAKRICLTLRNSLFLCGYLLGKTCSIVGAYSYMCNLPGTQKRILHIIAANKMQLFLMESINDLSRAISYDSVLYSSGKHSARTIKHLALCLHLNYQSSISLEIIKHLLLGHHLSDNYKIIVSHVSSWIFSSFTLGLVSSCKDFIHPLVIDDGLVSLTERSSVAKAGYASCDQRLIAWDYKWIDASFAHPNIYLRSNIASCLKLMQRATISELSRLNLFTASSHLNPESASVTFVITGKYMPKELPWSLLNSMP